MVLKTLQLMPGVQSAGEGNSGFYVRGGGPDPGVPAGPERPGGDREPGQPAGAGPAQGDRGHRSLAGRLVVHRPARPAPGPPGAGGFRPLDGPGVHDRGGRPRRRLRGVVLPARGEAADPVGPAGPPVPGGRGLAGRRCGPGHRGRSGRAHPGASLTLPR